MPQSDRLYGGGFNCSPECWSVFEEVLAAEFQDAVLFGRAHQTTVDAYAAQHPGARHRDKSIAVHLVGLHLVLERGLAPPDVPRRLQRLSGAVEAWPHFAPPEDLGPLTVIDVATAGSRQDHVSRVRAWAEQVWSAWRPHHAAVAGLAELCFAGGSARRAGGGRAGS